MSNLGLFWSRRRLLAAGSAGAVAAHAGGAPIPGNFPAHPVEQVKEMVTVAHGNAGRVRELLKLRPALVNASWDWGFGDWETALGAASHMGNREIAAVLLDHGAAPTLFSATMLGQLDVVKAMIVARPGVERATGPHSISLLAHARAGGPQSEAVVQYLQGLKSPETTGAEAMGEEELARLTGEYVFGPGSTEQVAISQKGGQLTFTRKGAVGRPLRYVGDRTFHPAGARAVRIRFEEDSVMTIHDGDLFVKASRL